jgi:hypothetical protein
MDPTLPQLHNEEPQHEHVMSSPRPHQQYEVEEPHDEMDPHTQRQDAASVFQHEVKNNYNYLFGCLYFKLMLHAFKYLDIMLASSIGHIIFLFANFQIYIEELWDASFIVY